MTLVPLAVAALYAVALFTLVHAIRNARTAQGAVGWAVFILTVPWAGVPIYALFGYARIESFTRVRRRAAEQVSDGSRSAVAPDPARIERLSIFDAISEHPATRGGGMDLLLSAPDAYDAMFDAIGKAETYVLVQFYTVRDDHSGGRLKDALITAAQTGATVRLMVDALGSITLPRSFRRELIDAGVEFAVQRGPARSLGRFGLNFRNHRKIVVVDGTSGFTGGVNIGDEYLANWRDTHARLTGPLASQLQSQFAQDWLAVTGEDIEESLNWTPGRDPDDLHGLLLSSGPTDPFESGLLYFNALAQSARRRLWIATPYFVPERTELAGLKLAALRGVDVRLLVPEVPDRWIPWCAAFAYFDEMRAAGVEIWRYQPHFMHQKVALVDDDIVSVGSINLDVRSSLLNFESTVIVADEGKAAEVASMLERDFSEALRLETTLDEQRLWLRAAAPLSRLLAPIL